MYNKIQKRMSKNTEEAMRILVIDDSEDSRDLTEGALLSAGYTDIVTGSAEDPRCRSGHR